MKEWLPENFTPPRGRASEAAKLAVKRGKARRRNEKIALSACSFLFVAVMSFMTVRGLAPVSAPAPVTDPSALENYSASAKGPTDVSVLVYPLKKGDEGVFSTADYTKTSPAIPSRNGGSPANSDETDFSLEKVDHSVAIKWDGEGSFAVYKCDSPKFDSCSIMEVVEGNSYLDNDENSGKIIYYRIEPLGKRG